MIKSMTGFGRGECMDDTKKFTVEMKAVNHRYFDVSIRMPKSLSFFDSAIRNTMKEYIQRGKVDVFISFEDFAEENYSLRYNESLAAEYLKYYRQMAETFGIDNDVRVSTLGRCQDVFTLQAREEDQAEIWQVLEKALRQACEQLAGAREVEGVALREDLMNKLDRVAANVELVKERYPQIIREYEACLKEKVRELLDDTQIDENRLAEEIILFSDKLCTDEETVRLLSHIETMRKTLMNGDGIGRKLDFIAQEMNREANTILSKANDLETSNIAIDLKTDIEKIREQIQNIE